MNRSVLLRLPRRIARGYRRVISQIDFHVPPRLGAFFRPRFRRLTAGALVVVIVAGFFAWYQFRTATTAEAAWLDESWAYRVAVPVTNNGSALTNYQLSFTVDTATPIAASKMQGTCQDIRITDLSGQLLPYWIEENNPGCNNSATKIWVKVPNLPAGTTTLYMYYGNPLAQAFVNANGSKVFTFFDSFESGTMAAWPTTGTWTTNATAFAGSYSGYAAGSRQGLHSAIFANAALVTMEEEVYFSETTQYHYPLLTAGVTNGEYVLSALSNGHFGYFNGSSYVNLPTDTTYIASTWYKIQLDLNYTAHSYTVYINGVNKGTITDNAGFNGDSVANQLYILNTDSSGTGGMRVDNVMLRQFVATNAPTAGSVGSEEKSNGPIGYWKFDEGYGNTAFDASGQNHPAPLNSTIWQTEDQCVSGKCLLFNGTTSKIQMNSANWPNPGTDSFSLSVWVRLTSISAANNPRVFNYAYDANNGFALLIGGNTTPGQPTLDVVKGSTHYSVGGSGATVMKVGTWYHLAATFDSPTHTPKLYVNAALQGGSGLSSTLPTTLGQGQIGDRDGGTLFIGYMDGPKVYNYARSATQVVSEFNSRGVSVPPAGSVRLADQSYLSNGLVGYYKMDETSWTNDCATATVTDSSGLGSSGVSCPSSTGPTGGAPGKFGNAGSFDGVNDSVNLSNASSVQGAASSGTLSLWFNRASHDGTLRTGWDLAGTGNAGAVLFLDAPAGTCTADQIAFQYGDGGATHQLCATVSDSTWYLATVTWSSSGVSLYLNGALQASNTANAPAISIPATSYLGSNGNSTRYFAGSLDEARLYSRAFSGDEVAKLYNWAPRPVGYWNFNEKTGATINDTSGNGSAAGWQGSGSSHWAPGEYGSAGNLNGTDDYALISSPSAVLKPALITASAWVQPSQFTTSGHQSPYIISEQPRGAWNDGRGYYMSLGSAKVSFTIGSASGTWTTVTGSTTLTAGTRYYVTGTYDGANLKVYVNGVLDGTVATTITISYADYSSSNGPNPQTLYLGAQHNGTNSANTNTSDMYFYGGRIDDVRLYNYARTPAQITQDMNGGEPVATTESGQTGTTTATRPAAPYLYYKLDEGQGTTATNNGSGGLTYNGTLTDIASPATTTSGWTTDAKFGKALALDGTNDRIQSIAPTLNKYTGDDLSMSLWFKRSSSDTDISYLISKPWNGSGEYNYQLDVNGSGYLQFTIRGNGSSVNNVTTQTVPADTWEYIAVSINGTAKTDTIYWNGKALTTASFASISSWTPSLGDGNLSLVFGCAYPYNAGWAGLTTNCLGGQMDEVKMWNAALSAADIKTDYNRGAALAVGTNTSNDEGFGGNPPIAEWKLDEHTGTTANDTSGNNHTSTLTGGPTWTQGKFGSGLAFTSTGNKYVNTGNSTAYNFSGTNHTVEAWFKSSSASTDASGFILQRFTGGTPGAGYYLGLSGNRLEYNERSDGGDTLDIYPGTSYTDGKWHFVAVTVDTSAKSGVMYVDGIRSSSDTYTGNLIDLNANLTIGSGGGSSFRFNGSLDQIRLYTYARSQAQVAYDYDRGAPVGWWKLNECKGTTLYDASGNANNGTLNLGASGQTSPGDCTTNASTAWYNGASGKFNASLNFDGTDDYVSAGDPASGALDFGTGDFSIAAWVKATDYAATTRYIVGKLSSTNLGYRLSTGGVGDEGKLRLSLGDGSTTNYVSTVTMGLTNGNWAHVVAVVNRSGNTVTFYVNGSQLGAPVSTAATSGNINSADPFTIGSNSAAPANNGNNWSGQIDDVRIYNYGLAAAQVKTVMNQGGALRDGQ